jgi:hypothetical protein
MRDIQNWKGIRRKVGSAVPPGLAGEGRSGCPRIEILGYSLPSLRDSQAILRAVNVYHVIPRMDMNL